jgi:hypothetical protein
MNNAKVVQQPGKLLGKTRKVFGRSVVMDGVLYQCLSNDHDRLDDLLERATAKPGVIDSETYADFRKRLLRHISIEEKIVLPAIARWRGGQKATLADRLHLDHGANPLEENSGGLYDIFETLAGAETETMLEELKAAPAVPVLPHNPKPELLELAKKVLARSGHEFKEA